MTFVTVTEARNAFDREVWGMDRLVSWGLYSEVKQNNFPQTVNLYWGARLLVLVPV